MFRFIIVWLIIIVGVRSFIVEPFNIPSGSMIPTLQVGDYVAVTKYSYGYSRFSLPFGLNLFPGRVFGSTPHRGDVAVFRFTKDNSVDYIKRIVGLPGDRIQVRGGELYLNGQLVPRRSLGDYAAYDENRTRLAGTRYVETLPGSAGRGPVAHQILKLTDDGQQNDTPEYVVPAGTFFAMGDDRDDSADSRFQGDDPEDLGYVPMQNLVGKAQFVFLSLDERYPVWQIWEWPFEIRWSRLLSAVR
nr:signal peptidase I [Neoasaia chiangmaiensis]